MPRPFVQVFPRVSSRPPKLLEQLESILVDRLRNNDKAASTAPLLTKDRDPGMATNLSLDAHRQTMSAFIGGFSTYTALLTRVQVREGHTPRHQYSSGGALADTSTFYNSSL